MQLIESLPRIDKNKVAEIIYQCMEHLSSLSPDFLLTANDFEFGGLFEATGLQGQTGLGCKDGKFIQVLTFNANLFREGLEDLYLNTVYHEFLHVIVNKYMIDHDIIRLAENDQFMVVNRTFFEQVQNDNGHGGLWLEYAVRANKVLDLKIPITPYCSDKEMDKVFESSVDDYGEPPIEIVCQDCGLTKKFLTIHPEELPHGLALLAMYFDTKNGFKNNMCKLCKGTLYIIIRDNRLSEFLDKELENHIMELFFHRMMMDGALQMPKA